MRLTQGAELSKQHRVRQGCAKLNKKSKEEQILLNSVLHIPRGMRSRDMCVLLVFDSSMGMGQAVGINDASLNNRELSAVFEK